MTGCLEGEDTENYFNWELCKDRNKVFNYTFMLCAQGFYPILCHPILSLIPEVNTYDSNCS